MTHIAYDFGILDFLGKNKTKLTLCGKRVSMSNIDNHNPTCEACKEEKRQAEELAATLQGTK